MGKVKVGVIEVMLLKIEVMKVEFRCKTVVCSDLEIVKNFIDDILDEIHPIIKDEDTMFDIKLILNELIINGVMHGNECVSSKCIKLLLEIRDKKLKIEVEDEGKGINYDFVSYDPENLQTCGRGLVIVNGLSDEFYIKKNKVIAVKALD